jgi:hypothetical protein
MIDLILIFIILSSNYDEPTNTREKHASNHLLPGTTTPACYSILATLDGLSAMAAESGFATYTYSPPKTSG